MLPFALSRHSSRPGAHWGSQYFCRPQRPGKKLAVTANTVSFFKFLLISSIIILKSKASAPDLPHIRKRRHLRLSRCDAIGGDVIKRMVRITGNPQAVEKHSKFPSHGYDGSFLATLPTPLEASSGDPQGRDSSCAGIDRRCFTERQLFGKRIQYATTLAWGTRGIDIRQLGCLHETRQKLALEFGARS